jgi:hypothetical protein
MKAFISYSHTDEKYVERLHVHLAQMKREGSIDVWHDRTIMVGGTLDQEIDTNLADSDLFLAITSPDFIASGYCYEKEMIDAIAMHDRGEIRIVPIIVEPCDWINTPLQRYLATPKDGKAVSEWSNPNSAFLEVVTDLRKIANAVTTRLLPQTPKSQKRQTPKTNKPIYRTKRDFDKIDRIEFKKSAFSEIAKNLRAYCQEADKIDGIRALFEQASQDRFFVTLVNKNKSNSAAERTVYMSDGSFMSGVNILHGRSDSSTSSNGSFSIEADDYDLFLRSLMSFRSDRERKLSPADVADEIWGEMMQSVGIEHAS